jgi:hypothetical protein
MQVRLREVDEETKRINLSLQPVASGTTAKDVSPLVDADKNELRTGKITSILAARLLMGKYLRPIHVSNRLTDLAAS